MPMSTRSHRVGQASAIRSFGVLVKSKAALAQWMHASGGVGPHNRRDAGREPGDRPSVIAVDTRWSYADSDAASASDSHAVRVNIN